MKTTPGRRRITPKGRRDGTSAQAAAEPEAIAGALLDKLRNRPDWSDHSHSLAITLASPRGNFLLHGIFNAYWEPLAFEVPAATNNQGWRRCIDKALASPDDISPIEEAVLFTGTRYLAQPRSVVVLVLGLGTTTERDRRRGAADWRP